MPDPTPTPDTLRAAVERVRTVWAKHAEHDWYSDHTRELLRLVVQELDAALAASPAPTDTPDERRAPSFHWTPCTCHPVRPAAVTAPREDERAGGPCPATCRLIQVHRHCPGDCSCVTFPYTEDRWPDAARWSASEVRP